MLATQHTREPNKTPQYFSVSEASQQIRHTLESSFRGIRIRGEVSGTTYHNSGHLYFTIKDETSSLDVVMWRGTVSKLPFKVEDGLDIIITGDITTFSGRSKYQLSAKSLEISGDGSLLKLLEERKQKLRAEGLFYSDLKKEIPFFPKVIGVISSPTGAVIRDILHRIRERCPSHVILWPSAVQGESAPQELIRAIEGFNNVHTTSTQRADVLILARGGGSIEDMWCFNDETLVRAVAQSEIPIISAVGHETDTTLVDFASDKRAPTPTAAAEMAVPVLYEVQSALANRGNQITRETKALLDEKLNSLNNLSKLFSWTLGALNNHQQRLDHLTRRLRSPKDLLNEASNRLIVNSRRFELVIANAIQQNQAKITRLGHALEGYSYAKTLARGFAVVRTSNNAVVTSAKTANQQTSLSIEFQDGCIDVGRQAQKPKNVKRKAARKSLNLFD